MENDIVLVDKPVGFTTYDVIRKLKKNYPRGTKIGHAGTLDPFATGLVIVLLGKENKRQSEYHQLAKEYVVEAIFNKQTDTGDCMGVVINEDEKIVTEENIKKEIEKSFMGKIEQIPPKYSAKHVDGKRAYDLAREGLEFNLKPSVIEVFAFDIIKYVYPTVQFKIVCGSGTYVRSLISDLAINLGTYAYCNTLRRTKIGEYNVDNSIKL